jgi:hypothetical protein
MLLLSKASLSSLIKPEEVTMTPDTSSTWIGAVSRLLFVPNQANRIKEKIPVRTISKRKRQRETPTNFRIPLI